ncbi:hypothetical protein BB561_002732 [Smittium simulii]|uniref:Uncharacterized protein n=1 Tax=Smittium simulii TaxID=133385 RepID=A0A2T9YPA9_9FUNG|nr:hypothetical protein BB561_002732 [Smittium simulii]
MGSIYDVLDSTMMPEQKFNIFSAQQSSIPSINYAVSFSMGHYNQQGWERVSLYVVTNDGDILCASPFILKDCIYERNWIENMLIQSEVEAEELKSQQYSVGKQLICPPELQDAIFTLNWVKHLYTFLNFEKKTNASNSINEPKSGCRIMYDDEIIISTPVFYLSKIKFQEPFLMRPSPPEIIDYNADSNDFELSKLIDDAYEIITLNTNPISIIAVSYFGGRINLFGLVDPIYPCWNHKKNQDMSANLKNKKSLLTIESINLPKQQKYCSYPVTLLPTNTNSNIIFAGASSGLYQIDFNAWCDEFKKKFEKNSENLVQSSISNQNYPNLNDSSKPPSFSSHNSEITYIMDKLSIKNNNQLNSEQTLNSVVKCLVKFDNTVAHDNIQPFTGIAEIQDLYCSYSLALLIKNDNFIGIPMLLPEHQKLLSVYWESNYQKISAIEKINHPIPAYVPDLASITNPSENSVIYSGDVAIASLNLFDSSIPALKFENSLSSAKNSLKVNEDSLYILGAFAAKLRYNMQNIADCSEKLNQRVQIQRKEFDRQKDSLSQILQNLKKFSNFSNENSLYRLLEIKKKQQLIAQKIEYLLILFSTFKKNYESSIELNVANKLKSVEKILSGENNEINCENSINSKIKAIESLIANLKSQINKILSSFSIKMNENISSRLNQRLGYGLHLALDQDVSLSTELLESVSQQVLELQAKNEKLINKASKFLNSD